MRECEKILLSLEYSGREVRGKAYNKVRKICWN